jgi:DnaJ-domain-containing protein 1
MSDSMSEHPQLSLGNPPQTLQKKLTSVSRGWLALIVLLNLATLGCLAALLLRPTASAAGSAGAAVAGPADELKAAAAALEDKSLDAEAARMWEGYLSADPMCAQRAEILYRIGRLWMQADQFSPAAAAFVRAERVAGDDQDLKNKIGPQIVECLNRLGRYGEAGRELSRRVEAGTKDKAGEKAGPRVLATLTGQNFTEADLDRMIERRIDHMLALQGGGEPQQRQAILQQTSAPAVRRQLLKEFLRTDLFCRRARELGLDRDQDFQQAHDQLLQNLLAERFLMRELEKINPTPVDLESHFKAHQSDYETPELLQVVTIRLDEKDDAASLLEKIASADDFRKLAAQRQPAGADAKPEGRQLVRSRQDPELGDVETLFAMDEGHWTKQPHLGSKDRFLVLVEKKTPRRNPQLQEVLDRVRADYTSRKQEELAEKLFTDLMQRYNVRIMPDAMNPGDEKPAEGEAKPAKPEKF